MYHAANKLYPQTPNPSLSFPLLYFASSQVLSWIWHTPQHGARYQLWSMHGTPFLSSLHLHSSSATAVFEVVSVSYCCWNRWPHMGGLKRHKFIILQLWRSESQWASLSWNHLLIGLCSFRRFREESILLTFPVSKSHLCSLALSPRSSSKPQTAGLVFLTCSSYTCSPPPLFTYQGPCDYMGTTRII